jgi:DNA-binding NarL/FixJ family response regulator
MRALSIPAYGSDTGIRPRADQVCDSGTERTDASSSNRGDGGKAALDRLAQYICDVVVSNLRMPGGGAGIAVYRPVQSLPTSRPAIRAARSVPLSIFERPIHGLAVSKYCTRSRRQSRARIGTIARAGRRSRE